MFFVISRRVVFVQLPRQWKITHQRRVIAGKKNFHAAVAEFFLIERIFAARHFLPEVIPAEKWRVAKIWQEVCNQPNSGEVSDESWRNFNLCSRPRP
jgi:hypothetical protein